MKFRNKFVSKRIGTKTLASLLAFGMALGSPMAVFADDGETAVVAENTVQAKKTDGSEVFASVSDYVRGLMESGAVRLNNETGYLEDTSTGQKVDPETGERLTETRMFRRHQPYRTPLEIKKIQSHREPRRIQKTQRFRKNRTLRELQRHRKNRTLRKIQGHRKNRTLRKIQGHRKNRTLRKIQGHRKNQNLQKSRILRELQRHRKNQALRKIRIARIPANPIPKIRFRHRILIRQILPKTGKIQRPTQFREVRSTIHRRSAKQKKQPVRTNQKLQSVILN